MPTDAIPVPTTKRRWLFGLEPFLEGGWLHKGRRARSWDVEANLGALSLLGDVCVNLSSAKSLPPNVEIHAYAIGRDVDVRVPIGTHVELSGRANNDHLKNSVPEVTAENRELSVKILGHTFLGDVTVRTSPPIS